MQYRGLHVVGLAWILLTGKSLAQAPETCPNIFSALAIDLSSSIDESANRFIESLDRLSNVEIKKDKYKNVLPETKKALKKESGKVIAAARSHLQKIGARTELAKRDGRSYLRIVPSLQGHVFNRLAYHLKNKFQMELRYDPYELAIDNYYGLTESNYIVLDYVSIFRGRTSSILTHELRHAYLNARHAGLLKNIPTQKTQTTGTFLKATIRAMKGEPSRFSEAISGYDLFLRLDEILAHLQGFRYQSGLMMRMLDQVKGYARKAQELEEALLQSAAKPDDQGLWAATGRRAWEVELLFLQNMTRAKQLELDEMMREMMTPEMITRIEGMAELTGVVLKKFRDYIALAEKSLARGVFDEMNFGVYEDAIMFMDPKVNKPVMSVTRLQEGEWQLVVLVPEDKKVFTQRIGDEKFIKILENHFVVNGKVHPPQRPEPWNGFFQAMLEKDDRAKELEKYAASLQSLAKKCEEAVSREDLQEYNRLLVQMRGLTIQEFYREGL